MNNTEHSPEKHIRDVIPGVDYAAVISMDKDVARRRTHLDSAPFAPAVVPGVDVRAWTDEQIEQNFDVAGARRRYGRPLSRGEIGCSLAHLSAMREFLEATDGRPAETLGLITEDDTVYADGALPVLVRLAGVTGELTMLGYHTRQNPFVGSGHATITELTHGNALVRLVPFVGGAQGYLLSRATAERIVSQADAARPDWMADDYQRFYGMGLDVCGLRHPILLLAEHSDTSSIGAERTAEQRRQAAMNQSSARGGTRAWTQRLTSHAWPPRYSVGTPAADRVWLAFARMRARLPLALRGHTAGRAVTSAVLTATASMTFVSRAVNRARRR